MKTLLLFTTTFLLSVTNLSAQLAGNSLHMDGVDDYVVCDLPVVFDDITSNDFTIEMWVKQESSQFCRLIYAQSDADNFACLSLNSTNEIVFYLSENSVNHSIQSTDVITNAEWTHIAASWDASTMESKIYINGTEANYAGGLYVSSTGTDATMTIGSRTDGNQYFNGEFDEVSIWGTVKTQCEIATELTSKLAGDETDLLRYYSFDSGTAGGLNTGVTTLDAGPFAAITANGTLTNFTLAGTTSNWLSSGATITKNYGDASAVTLTGQTLTGEEVFSDFFAWIDCSDNSQIPGATSSTFNPINDDPNFDGTARSYAMISTDLTCVDTTECFLFDVTGFGELDQANFSIYPNPSNGAFFVDLPSGAEEVQIFSMNGKLIESFVPNGESTMQIKLPQLNGFYLLRIKTNTAILSEKISIRNN
ncbi:MAG: hypothetical protein ACJASQ_000332 [Crocinitomicaceae bacterium]|jgi:hypothetical protein